MLTTQEQIEEKFKNEWMLNFPSGDNRLKYPTQFYSMLKILHTIREGDKAEVVKEIEEIKASHMGKVTVKYKMNAHQRGYTLAIGDILSALGITKE